MPKLSRYQKHTIELLIDELTVAPEERERLTDSVESALRQSSGLVTAEMKGAKVPATYSEKNACPHCAIGFGEMEPRLFSFNSPFGACPDCTGLGVKTEIDENLVIPDPTLSVREGAIAAWSTPVTTKSHRWQNSWSSYYWEIISDVCARSKINLDAPWKTLPQKHRDLLLYGGSSYRVSWSGNDKEFEGVIGNLNRRYTESESEYVREEIFTRFMTETR